MRIIFFKKLKHYLNSYSSNVFSITNWEKTQFQIVTLNSITFEYSCISWMTNASPHISMIVVNICKGTIYSVCRYIWCTNEFF